MKKKLKLISTLLILIFISCNKSEDNKPPATLRTDGLYIALHPGAYSFEDSQNLTKITGGVLDIIRFYTPDTSIFIRHSVLKNYVISKERTSKWFIDMKKAFEEEDKDVTFTTEIPPEIFKPTFSSKDSIKFMHYDCPNHNCGLFYFGKIYKDSLIMKFTSYFSEKEREKFKPGSVSAGTSLGPETFKFYPVEQNKVNQ